LGELPPASVSVATALGGMSKAAKAVAVLLYEATALRHRDHCAPAYDGARPATIEARIVTIARLFTALVADPDEELSADQAITRIRTSCREDADETVIRLMMNALGIYPTGTLVELDDGTIAQVVHTPNE